MERTMTCKSARYLSVLFIATAANAQDFGPPQLELFDVAPEIDLTFVKGEPTTLAEGRGKNVFILEYWATWCAPCKVTIPHLTKLQQKYKDEGLVIIGVSDESLAKVQPFVAKMGDKMEYTVAIDPKRTTLDQYTRPFKINSIPHAFVIDKAGRLMWHGHPGDPILEPLVDALLEEEVEAEPESAESSDEADND